MSSFSPYEITHLPKNLANNLGNRIIIIGPSCAGKSTLASHLSKITGYETLDLDTIQWKTGNWMPRETNVFIQEVEDFLDNNSSWIISGNYGEYRDLIWSRGTSVIHLCFPFWTLWFRLLSRSFKRWWYHVPLFDTNCYETPLMWFDPQQSLFYWLWTRYDYNRQKLTGWLQDSLGSSLFKLRLYNACEVDQFHRLYSDSFKGE